MRKLTTLFFIILVLTRGLVAVEDRVNPVDSGDPSMAAAIEKARSTLPHFWTKLEERSSELSDFNLKVRIEDENGVEHFWCAEISKGDEGFSGIVNNEPHIVKSVANGQRISFEIDQISDWLYYRDGKMIGNYTIRPLLARMSEAERREIEAMLGPLP